MSADAHAHVNLTRYPDGKGIVHSSGADFSGLSSMATTLIISIGIIANRNEIWEHYNQENVQNFYFK